MPKRRRCTKALAAMKSKRLPQMAIDIAIIEVPAACVRPWRVDLLEVRYDLARESSMSGQLRRTCGQGAQLRRATGYPAYSFFNMEDPLRGWLRAGKGGASARHRNAYNADERSNHSSRPGHAATHPHPDVAGACAGLKPHAL
jgi:hypothetical protein